MSTLHAFEFLEKPAEHAAAREHGIFVLFGDERFLRLLVQDALLREITTHEAEFDTMFFDGESATWADVADQLFTVSLFAQDSPRVVVVTNGEDFVTNFRRELESLVDQSTSRKSGILVLHVTTWAANTRLYKSVDRSACQIRCAEPVSPRGKSRDATSICKWICARGKTAHGLALTQTLARQLMEIVEWNLARADQELAKLALFDVELDAQAINQIVGGWKAQSIWDAVSAAAIGKTDEALTHLANLLQSGEHALALYGQLSWSLRRYGRLWELVSRQTRRGQRTDLSVTLAAAGFRNWGGEISNAEASVKQLTRRRVRKIYGWLRETDLALKGSHSEETRARLALEKLFFRMARESASGAAGNS